jgi:transcriptional regulator with PAS, ATPase and Fis domain
MIESELFGYKKGAYTGAESATTGMIEEAEGGTFYLNEIADASPEMQAKLLDVLETRTVRPNYSMSSKPAPSGGWANELRAGSISELSPLPITIWKS